MSGSWRGYPMVGVPDDYVVRIKIENSDHWLFVYSNEFRFVHICDRGERGIIVCGPVLQTANGAHQVLLRPTDSTDFLDPTLPITPGGSVFDVTVTPSILCEDCGTHGFITNTKWKEA